MINPDSIYLIVLCNAYLEVVQAERLKLSGQSNSGGKIIILTDMYDRVPTNELAIESIS